MAVAITVPVTKACLELLTWEMCQALLVPAKSHKCDPVVGDADELGGRGVQGWAPTNFLYGGVSDLHGVHPRAMLRRHLTAPTDVLDPERASEVQAQAGDLPSAEDSPRSTKQLLPRMSVGQKGRSRAHPHTSTGEHLCYLHGDPRVPGTPGAGAHTRTSLLQAALSLSCFQPDNQASPLLIGSMLLRQM